MTWTNTWTDDVLNIFLVICTVGGGGETTTTAPLISFNLVSLHVHAVGPWNNTLLWRQTLNLHLPVRKDAVRLVLQPHRQRDVFGQLSGHLHGVDVVRRRLQDGVVAHEMGGTHVGGVVLQHYSSTVRSMTSTGGQQVLMLSVKRVIFLTSKTEESYWPFPALDVGVIRQEHWQKPHEVSAIRPQFTTGSRRPAVYTGRIHHCNTHTAT